MERTGLSPVMQSRWAPPAIVAVFAALIACAGLFVLPPLDRDESRFAQATAQMLETGDFVTIRFQDAERNKKPAGIHWLQAAAVSTFSAVEDREIWAYRLPSALGLILASLFTYFCGARLFGPQVGLLGALLLAATPLAAGEAGIAKTDAALLATVAAAQCAFIHIFARVHEGRAVGILAPAAFWAALSAAILIKGPIAPMILALTMIAVAALRRDRSWLRALKPGLGLVIIGLAVAPWLLAVNAATEGRFLAEALGRDMFGKIGASQESHAGPPGFHLALAPLLLWPAIALAPAALLDAWRDRRAWQSLLLAAWIVPGWIVFELTATKLPHYVLPFYPALCLLVAHTAFASPPHARPAARRAGAALYGVIGAIFASALVALPAVYGTAGAPPLASIVAALVILGAAVAVAALFWRGRAATAAFAAAGLSAAFVWALFSLTPQHLKRLDVSRSISAALDEAGLHPMRDKAPPAALAGYSEPSAIFLLGTRTALGDGGDAARHLKTHPGSAAVVEAQEEPSFLAGAAEAGLAPRRLAVVDGVNYSKGRTVRLYVFAIAR